MLATSQSGPVVMAMPDLDHEGGRRALPATSRRKLTGKRPTDAYFRAVTRLGENIAEGGFEAIAGIDADEILMPYSA